MDSSADDVSALFQVASPDESLSQLQREDKSLKFIIDYLQHGILPDGNDKLCRQLVVKKDLYYLNDNSVLCRANMPNRKESKSTDV